MSIKKAKHAQPSQEKGRRRLRAGVVAVGVLAVSLMTGAAAAEADVLPTYGSKLCSYTNSCVVPQGVRWQ